MEDKLFGYLQHEYELLQQMIRNAERQQVALVKYQITELNEIISFQDALIKSIRDAEKTRISYLINWLKIGITEATEMPLSVIIDKFDNEEVIDKLKSIRSELRKSIERLYNLNATNRLLTNRAKINVKEILGYITGGKAVFNVEV